MTRVRPTQLVFGILALLLASGCNPRPNPTAPNWTFFPGPDTGSMLGDDGMSFLVGDKNKRGGGGTGGGGGVGVNAFLWRGALDTLGFMPLSSADPFGGAREGALLDDGQEVFELQKIHGSMIRGVA